MKKKSKKIGSILVAAVILVATLGAVSAIGEKDVSSLSEPSIQRSMYYKYIFTVESTGQEPVYLLFDRQRKEMHPIKEGGNTYIASMPFSSGGHRYKFICDSAQLPERGVYELNESDSYWLLLNTLAKHFSWHEKEEKELKTEFKENKANAAALENLYNLQMDRIRVSAMIQGTLTRIQDLPPPQNFDKEKLLRQLTDAASGYSLFSNVSNLRGQFQQTGEAYIKDAITTYSELSSARRVSRNPKQEFKKFEKAVNELKLAKERKKWSTIADASEKIVSSAEELACIDRRFLQILNSGIEHLYTGIAGFYGDEEFGKQQIRESLKDNFDVDISEEKLDVDIPQKKSTQECQRCKPSSKSLKTGKNKDNTMERQGKTNRTSYAYTGYTTRSAQKEKYGNTYRVDIDVHWGKLKNQPRMDYSVEVTGDASEETWISVGYEAAGCMAGMAFTEPQKYTSWLRHQWNLRRPPFGEPGCEPPECWKYHSCVHGFADFRNRTLWVYTENFLAGYEHWWEDGPCSFNVPR